MEAITGQFCEEQEQNCPEWVCWWQCQGLEICTNYVLFAATYAAQKVSSCFLNEILPFSITFLKYTPKQLIA